MKDLDSIYFDARGLPPKRRPAFLDLACEGDPELKARVEQMLAVSSQAEAFITDLPDDQLEARKFESRTAQNPPG